MNRTGRGVLGNVPASGTEIIQELGEEHQETGKWIVYTSADSVFQIAAHEETIPLEELYDGCRIAREILTGKHAVGRVIARPFIGEPGQLRADAEPARLLARAAAAELPDARSATRATRSTASERSRDIFAHLDIDEEHPDEVERRGDHRRPRSCSGELDDGLDLHEPRRDGHALGAPQRPGQLPPLPAGLRPAAARPARRAPARRPADHHVGPRLRPDDAVDRPLARACAAPRLRRGQERERRIHEGGEFADVGATVNAWLGGKPAGQAAAGQARSSSRDAASTTRSSSRRAVRGRVAAARRGRRVYGVATGEDARERLVEAVAEVAARARVLEVGCGGASSPSGSRARLGGGDRRARSQSERMVELALARGVDARRRRRAGAAVRGRRVRLAVAAWMLYHVPDLDRALARARARAAAGRPARCRHQLAAPPDRDARAGGRAGRRTCRSAGRTGAELLAPHFADVATAATSTGTLDVRRAEPRSAEYLRASIVMSPLHRRPARRRSRSRSSRGVRTRSSSPTR